MQTPDLKNPYQLLQIEPSFSLSKTELDRAYFKMQRENHPDRASAVNRGAAELMAAELNKAYRDLKDPLSRAKALAAFYGHSLEVQSHSQEILMEAMHWREAVSSLTPDSDNKESVRRDLESNIQECLDQIESAFEKKEYSALSPLVTRLSFLQKVKEEIKGKVL